MAEDWIKMRADLRTSPKVVRIASALSADKCPDRLRVIGALHAAWSLFDTHSEDGVLVGYTPEILDELIGWPGFTTQMIAVEWASFDGESIALPRFEDHNGASAKRRAMEAKRKADARKLSASDADKKRTRGEERRVSKPKGLDGGGKPPPFRLPDLDWLPRDTWAIWHAFRNARGKGWTSKAKELSLRTLTKLHDEGYAPLAVIEQSIEKGWTGLFPVHEDHHGKQRDKTSGAANAVLANIQRNRGDAR